jgi:hypothetical protein
LREPLTTLDDSQVLIKPADNYNDPEKIAAIRHFVESLKDLVDWGKQNG